MLDENVPASVADMLLGQGHIAEFIRDYVPPGSPDPLVATISENLQAILISFDGDFQKIAPRIPLGVRRRFRGLSRITMRCGEPQASARLELALPFIHSEYTIAQNSNDARCHITIGKSWLRTDR